MATSKDFRVKNGLVVEQDINVGQNANITQDLDVGQDITIGQDILLGGSFKDLSGNLIELGGTSSDTYTVKDALILQQSENLLGTVVSKSIVPATTEYVEYVGNGGSSSTNQIYSVLNYNYAYFYSTYADIYSPIAGNDKLKELFAPGNTVRITKDGYWWDLSISSTSFNTTYINVQYSITGTNSPWSSPEQWQSYWDWSANISFSSNLPVAPKNALNLNSPAFQLVEGDKLIINGNQNGAPYVLSTNTIGTWDIAVTNQTSYDVIFGSNVYNSDTENIRKLLQVGNVITIADNNWGVSGVYLVANVEPDPIWNSANGFKVTFQYVSGENYPVTYTSMGALFSSYFSSASATLIPNYSTEYLDRFVEVSGNSYRSFDNYDFLAIGDVLEYIPATTAVTFKDDAGNNVKAITYNNSTAEINYDGLITAINIDSNSNLLSTNSNNTPITFGNTVVLGNNARAFGVAGVAIGLDSQASEQSVGIGRNARAGSQYGIALGYDSNAQYIGTAIGFGSYGGSWGVSIGYYSNTNSYGVAIGHSSNATGSSAVAIGYGASSGHACQITLASTLNTNYVNQTTTFSWADGNLTRNGVTYLVAANGQTSSTQSATTTSSTYSVDIANRFVKNSRMMMIGTATILIKPTGDQNNDDTKVIEMKMAIRSTANNTFVLEPISTTTVFAGTGTLHPNWTPSFELFNNRYLHFKLDKGTDSTPLGISCKLEFQVLHTA